MGPPLRRLDSQERWVLRLQDRHGCTSTDLPLAWNLRTAREAEQAHALALIDAVKARGFAVETAAMDKGYDARFVYEGCEDRDVRPIKAERMFPLVPRDTPRWSALYRGRAGVEREFGRLKHEWALAPLRVRGLDRVRLHADLTILAKLACALTRARAVPLAA